MLCSPTRRAQPLKTAPWLRQIALLLRLGRDVPMLLVYHWANNKGSNVAVRQKTLLP